VNRPLLRHPAVIGGVIVGLLAVVALNIRTFASGRSFLDRGAGQARDYLVPPDDLSDVVHQAVYGEASDRGPAVAAAAAGPGLARDPFSGATTRPSAPAAPSPRRAPTRAPAPSTPLVCTAVMLGGQEPLALIDGETRHPGDSVRGHEIVSIAADGVLLRRADGREIMLAVGPAASDSTGFHVVTGKQIGSSRGDTRLATESTERTER
jgi:hypothetical protein